MQFADRVQTRLLQNAQATQEEVMQRAAAQEQKYNTFVQKNTSFFEGFLQVSGLSMQCHGVAKFQKLAVIRFCNMQG